MKLSFDVSLVSNYKSNSQKIRIMSETWTLHNGFCPNCGNKLLGLKNNKKVSDFLCEKCLENFEQKASKHKFKGKVISSEYYTFIKRLEDTNKPHFFFLYYIDKNYIVEDFFVVPKYFFVPSIIEKRKPLSSTAKRAGWIGSNILFDKIPNFGKIYYVQNGKEIPKRNILERWQKTLFLKNIKKDELKGWILDIINCIESLNKKEFSLKELYSFEKDLEILHPDNKHIKDKIRQQLQILRDKGYLQFVGRGKYKLL